MTLADRPAPAAPVAAPRRRLDEPTGRVRPLHATLVEELRNLIDRGDLQPGTRVQEKSLCARFAVSRTPLREALKVLAVEGLVVLLPNRGARVAVFDELRLRHAFEVVAALEAEAGRLACVRIDAAGIDAVDALNERMRSEYERHDLPGYFATNQAIHAAILAAANNPLLAATHATVSGGIRRARYLANRLDAVRWSKAMAEHDEIAALLRRRDGAALADRLAAHLANKREAILAQLRAVIPAD